MKKKYVAIALLCGLLLLTNCSGSENQSKLKTDYASNQTTEMQQEPTLKVKDIPVTNEDNEAQKSETSLAELSTPEPTAAPTPEPTAAPTPEPTAAPTPEPTTATNKSSVLVWIDDTAKRYHRKNGCGMDNAYQVPLEEAIEKGKTPCGRCYK